MATKPATTPSKHVKKKLNKQKEKLNEKNGKIFN